MKIDNALPRLLILEGPDGGGKTTLARALAARFGYVHIAHGPEPGKNAAALFHQYANAIARAGRNRVVIDRAWLSERVYGHVHRQFTRLDSYHERMLSRLALCFGGAHVFCMPPLEHCLRVFNGRRDLEMLQSNDALEAVHAYYTELFYKRVCHVPHVIYDVTGNDTFANVLTRLNATRTVVATQDCRPDNAQHVIGAWRPNKTILLVSDGPSRNGHHAWPFVATYPQSIGAWLTNELSLAGNPEYDLTWVNAVDAQWRWQSGDFIEALQPKRIVALGKVAAAWCSKWADTYRVVPRPEEMRLHSARFLHDALARTLL